MRARASPPSSPSARSSASRATSSARTREGAGLGLSIVRAIAEAHGGHAEVVGGAGATVRVWLPDAPHGARPQPGAVSLPAR